MSLWLFARGRGISSTPDTRSFCAKRAFDLTCRVSQSVFCDQLLTPSHALTTEDGKSCLPVSRCRAAA